MAQNTCQQKLTAEALERILQVCDADVKDAESEEQKWWEAEKELERRLKDVRAARMKAAEEVEEKKKAQRAARALCTKFADGEWGAEMEAADVVTRFGILEEPFFKEGCYVYK